MNVVIDGHTYVKVVLQYSFKLILTCINKSLNSVRFFLVIPYGDIILFCNFMKSL